MKRKLLLLIVVLWSALQLEVEAHSPALRRPISPSQPAWIIHIDVWNTPDPQRIIDMVPEDVRPYVIFNLSTSSTDAVSCDGPAVYDSWMKVCAQNRVWAMIQCSSGAHNRLSDVDTAQYVKYFQEYPNFLGFNFAEQFWDFGQNGCVTFPERLALFAKLLPICHEYGGYLAVSFTQAYYSADMMPMAYMKRNADWRNFMMKDKEHFLCFEKYTMSSCFFDIESNCLGAYLGGYAGQYGIRFDRCGWQDTDAKFVQASGAIPILEHVLLTGETMIDGPETIPDEDSHEVSTTQMSDGYTRRNWAWYPQMVNINFDEFRKILDGTVRIPTRNEVIARTKICIQNDIPISTSDDSDHNPYITPATLFDGVYRSPVDSGGTVWYNHWLDQRWWLKSTGRYPTIPNLNGLLDSVAKTLTVIKKSNYDQVWGDQSQKMAQLNSLFPEEYHGDIYAAHHENTWMTYNPYQYDEVHVDTTDGTHEYMGRHFYWAKEYARGYIPLQYNTCDSVYLSYSPYAMGIMKETPEKISFYLTNYRAVQQSGNTYVEYEQATDTIRVYGAVSEPVLSWTDRADHSTSTVVGTWHDGVFTITVTHNGPLDLDLDCSGRAVDRKTEWTKASLVQPESPEAYVDTLQLEAENFDYKNITACRPNGYYYGHSGCQGLGFIEMGTKSGASIRDTIEVPVAGNYDVILRYEPSSTATVLNMYCGTTHLRKSISGTTGQWQEQVFIFALNAGKNLVKLNYASGGDLFLDCVKFVSQDIGSGIRTLETSSDAKTIRTEYYDFSGRKLSGMNLPGLYIMKQYRSDGSCKISKVIKR